MPLSTVSTRSTQAPLQAVLWASCSQTLGREEGRGLASASTPIQCSCGVAVCTGSGSPCQPPLCREDQVCVHPQNRTLLSNDPQTPPPGSQGLGTLRGQGQLLLPLGLLGSWGSLFPPAAGSLKAGAASLPLPSPPPEWGSPKAGPSPATGSADHSTGRATALLQDPSAPAPCPDTERRRRGSTAEPCVE